MAITVDKRKVSKTGSALLGWRMGCGYHREQLKIEYDVWCILDDGKIIAEARSKKSAERIAEAFMWIGQGA